MQVLQLLLSGIAQGCIYGLIALGFVLIYKATETVSFAQGDLMMLGAFTAFAGMTLFGLPFWLAAILAVVAMAAFGMLVELAVIRPMRSIRSFMVRRLVLAVSRAPRSRKRTVLPDSVRSAARGWFSSWAMLVDICPMAASLPA